MKINVKRSMEQMWKDILDYFSPEGFDNLTIQSGLVVKILVVSFLGVSGALLVFLIGLLFEWNNALIRDIAIFSVFAAVDLLALFFHRAGRGGLARGLFILGLLVAVFMVGYLESNPVDDPFLLFGFFIVLLFALLLLDPFPVWLTVGLCASAYGLLHILWMAGMLPPEAQRNPKIDAVMLLFVFLMSAVMFVLLFQDLLRGYRDQSGKLEQQVEERTRSIAALAEERSTLNRAMLNMLEDLEASNEVLQQQKEELASVNRELSSFSYSVSHDLRAPLRAMDGFSRILMDDFRGELSEDAARYLGLIRKNAQHMGTLIDDLLSYSRSSRVEVRRAEIDPAHIVRGVWEELVEDLDQGRIRLEMRDLPHCHADPTLLRQVYQNLLDNALKYSSTRDRIRIEVGFHTIVGKESSVYYVRDNGVGFNMQYADKLFDVFQRLHSSETYEGTGVGLAIVSRIINRHGGRVWAESQEGQGAVFYFTLGRDQ